MRVSSWNPPPSDCVSSLSPTPIRSVPNALMTAELACMMPENGGHILWVDRAFGPFWSFINSYATLFSLVFEGGLYPVMFMDYVGQLMGVCVPVAPRRERDVVVFTQLLVEGEGVASVVPSATLSETPSVAPTRWF
jgi:amino acid transporter